MSDGGYLWFAQTADGYVTAIARYMPDVTWVWSASPDFSSSDACVPARLQGRFVIASTWSGHHVTLDATTGAQVARTFAELPERPRVAQQAR
jgi:hypothetical protein